VRTFMALPIYSEPIYYERTYIVPAYSQVNF
jgi:hypothetical protein